MERRIPSQLDRGAEVGDRVRRSDAELGGAKLEENFRSTQPILDVANAIIADVKESYKKRLYSRIDGGQPPVVVSAHDENEQSRFVAQRIAELRDEGVPLAEIAVLFRSSSHSFDLEI